MSNPVVTIGNSIPEPPDPEVVRKTFVRVVYEEQEFITYADGQDDTTFDPTSQGLKIYAWQQLGMALGLQGTQGPTFESDETWKALKRKPSGFITAVHSAMPKLMVPSQILVDNGVVTPNESFMGEYSQGGVWKNLFNWAVSGDWWKMAHVAGYYGSQYVTTRQKDDSVADNTEITLTLNNPSPAPTGEWEDDKLVVTGAFVLMLNTVPTTSGHDSPENDNKNTWSVEIAFGDVTMVVGDAGSLKTTISTGDGNTVSGNLADGKTKEGPPQQRNVEGKEPYIIVVYPVWNGVVVMSGGQDAKGVIHTASTFVPKYKEASIFVDYSSGFDPTSPAPVLVDTVAGGNDVTPSFGTSMTVTAKNCRIDLAYLPCFFSLQMWFDEWMLLSDNQAHVVSYNYAVYPIWTKNATDYELGPVTLNATGFQGSVANTSYKYVKWRLARPAGQTKYLRHAGELFGSILETDETREFPIKNGNGSFDLTWGAGTPGNPSDSDWRNYVQSLSTTVGVDGSSGTMVVDKYGVAGQDAVANQSLGAITLSVTGGIGTEDDGGTAFFKGLAMGVSDAASSGSATWTIPLVGQEKKLEDIMLINVPFFDGHTLQDTVKFLATYAGIDYDLAAANAGIKLSVSDDINIPRFDWKAGTSVKAALDSVMEDVLHSYVVRDGKIFVYELDATTGLPTTLGPDRSAGYPDTKVVSVDRTPNFDNLRNEIVVMALQQVPEGKGAAIEEIPLYPMTEVRQNATVPDVPWAKCIFRPLQGALTSAQLKTAADRIAAQTSLYRVLGNVTIPGNAQIRPYDQWGEFVIGSVSQSVDLQSKTWTTSLDLTKATK